MQGFKGKVCAKGVWDESIPDLNFDKDGVSSYAKTFERILADFPRGEKGDAEWEVMVAKMKADGKGKEYDCVVGVSGGTDSSYLLHIASKYKLRVLAVYLDNGWGSDIAVKNIKRLIEPLKIDLDTYVIEYEEVVEVLKAYIKAGLPWIDSPTDLAIKAILYKKAHKEKLKYVLIGHDFRTEGFQPNEWTYSDAKQLKFLTKKYGNKKLKSFPTISIWSFGYLSFLKGIKLVRPFFYLPYVKKDAKIMLNEKYGWEDYGGHHYENIFTKFAISYWLYEKFGIDKRKITNSALILSGEITKEEALEEIAKQPYNSETIEQDIEFLAKKLKMSVEEFKGCFNEENHSFYDYPSYYPMFERFKRVIFPVMKYFLPNKPLMFYQIEDKKNEESSL